MTSWVKVTSWVLPDVTFGSHERFVFRARVVGVTALQIFASVIMRIKS